MSFLPDTYNPPPPAGGNYMKLRDGDNRIRIMTPPILGNLFRITDGQQNRKPVRRRMDDEIAPDELGVDQHGQREKVKHFWAMVVWDYSGGTISILEVTQRTIQDAIADLDKTADWGDPREYDIIVKKSGSKLETSYNVMPCKPSPVPDAALADFNEKRPNLDALFSGGDPFDGTGPAPTPPTGNGKAAAIDTTAEDTTRARNSCFNAFLAENDGDKKKAMAAMNEAAKEKFPDKKSVDYTAKDWEELEIVALGIRF